MLVMCSRYFNWPSLFYNWVYIFHLVLSEPYSDVLNFKECQAKQLLVCCEIFVFFKAILKFCSAKKFFTSYLL